MSIKLINTEDRSSFSTKQTYCKKVYALKFAIAKGACTFSIFGQTKHTRHLSFQYFMLKSIAVFDLIYFFLCLYVSFDDKAIVFKVMAGHQSLTRQALLDWVDIFTTNHLVWQDLKKYFLAF